MAAKLLTVEDYRRRARRRIPRVVFDNVDGAAESESTMRANTAVFDEVGLRPRNGTAVGTPDLSTSLLGMTLSMPVVLAPCGMARVIDPSGDLAGARAAGAAGVAFALSMMSGHGLEEVAAAGSGPLWFQAYSFGGRDRTAAAIDRAAAAGYAALVVTLDTQVSPARLRDVRNGASLLLGPRRPAQIAYVPQLLAHPLWLARRVRDGLVPEIPNVAGRDGTPGHLWKDGRPSSITFEDFAWVRERFDGPLIAKGVLTGADAIRAIDAGADALVVSNHGGRQLDGTDTTLSSLPEVVAAVAKRCPVLMDSGVRRGADVIKALALGASAVLIGRPWLFALGAGGEAAIAALLEQFRADLVRNLQLMGVAKTTDLDETAVRAPAEWFTRRG